MLKNKFRLYHQWALFTSPSILFIYQEESRKTYSWMCLLRKPFKSSSILVKVPALPRINCSMCARRVRALNIPLNFFKIVLRRRCWMFFINIFLYGSSYWTSKIDLNWFKNPNHKFVILLLSSRNELNRNVVRLSGDFKIPCVYVRVNYNILCMMLFRKKCVCI